MTKVPLSTSRIPTYADIIANKLKKTPEPSKTIISDNIRLLKELTFTPQETINLILNSLLDLADRKRANPAYINPNGFAGINLSSSPDKVKHLALHINSPTLNKELNLQSFEEYPHNHRWYFSSFLATGSIQHQIYRKLAEEKVANLQNSPIKQVQEFYYPKRQSSEENYKLYPKENCYLLPTKLRTLKPGEIFSMHHNGIHSVNYPAQGLTATIILSNESGRPGNEIYYTKEALKSIDENSSVQAQKLTLEQTASIMLEAAHKIAEENNLNKEGLFFEPIRPLKKENNASSARQLQDFTLKELDEFINSEIPQFNSAAYPEKAINQLNKKQIK